MTRKIFITPLLETGTIRASQITASSPEIRKSTVKDLKVIHIDYIT